VPPAQLAADAVRAVLAVMAAAGLLAGAVAATAVTVLRPAADLEMAAGDVPELAEVVEVQHSLPSRVYAADGSLIGTFRPEHTYIPLGPGEIPENVRLAVLAAEDADFYQHRGFDPSAMVRAGARNLIAGEVLQGGSTITQQLAKNLVTGDERSLDRKVAELAAAIELEERHDKEEILAAYLNVAYFGDGANGVAAAAQAYFGKDVADLALSEAALLAGLLPAPSEWNPRRDLDAALARQTYVLDRLEALGAVDDDVLAWSRAEPLELVPQDPATPAHPFFVDYVRRYAIDELGLSNRHLNRGGLSIHTTLVPELQDWARAVVRIHVQGEDHPSGALAVVEPGTGFVRGLVGGDDWERSEVNLALGSRGAGSGRQPGSSFKTFVLAAALEAGLRPETTLPAPELYQPEGAERPMGNYGGGGYGSLSLDDATVRSVNTSFVFLTEVLGPEEVAQVARRFGIAVPEHPGPSLGIGAYETSPLDMAAAYAALANDGAWVAPSPITHVVDRDGEIIAHGLEPEVRQALEPDLVRAMHPVLRGVVERGTGRAADIGRPAFGKTGTSNDHRDAWFAGYTPQLAAAVWVGYPGVNRPMTSVPGVGRVTGGSLPAAIWRDVMGAAHAGLPVLDVPPPGGAASSGRPPPADVQRLLDSRAWSALASQPTTTTPRSTP
jgi:penicillin-binding protein 1A